jgi:hypothetical protein
MFILASITDLARVNTALGVWDKPYNPLVWAAYHLAFRVRKTDG